MSSTVFTTTDPYKGLDIESYEGLSDRALAGLLDHQHLVNTGLGEVEIADRTAFIASLGERLESVRDELAGMITLEMGKPIAQSLAEVDKCVWLCRYASEELSVGYTEDGKIDLGSARAITRHSPIGTVLGIMPWNFPIWQTLRFAVPAILNGNPVLLKPAPNVIGSSLILENCMHQACLSDEFFRVLIVDVDIVESIIAHRAVSAVTLTGSSRAGRVVASLAGKYLKPSVLELGGSDPFIVLKDSEVSAAARAYVDSRMNNTGQTCIAAKRGIVHDSVLNEFTEVASSYLTEKVVGDPTDPETDISCIARADLSDQLEDQIRSSVAGVSDILKPSRKDGSNVFQPGLCLVHDHALPIWREEIFGPVGAITAFRTNEEAVRLANDTDYGLGCSIWSDDIANAMSIAGKVQAGSIHINQIVSSDPRVPFGGLKDSGYGRELGVDGFRELTNLKTITFPIDT